MNFRAGDRVKLINGDMLGKIVYTEERGISPCCEVYWSDGSHGSYYHRQLEKVAEEDKVTRYRDILSELVAVYRPVGTPETNPEAWEPLEAAQKLLGETANEEV